MPSPIMKDLPGDNMSMSKQVYINSISAFFPNDPVDNSQMESVLGQIGQEPSRIRKMILRKNRIKSRYYAIDPQTRVATHTNTQLTAQAVRKLGTFGYNINDIKLLACGTSLPDQLMPNHALMVHGELGIPPCEVIATAGICLSGIMALKYGYMSVLSGQSVNAVATGSENSSSVMRSENFEEEIEENILRFESQPEIAFEKNFLRWMLSDGAGAIWMSNAPNGVGISLQIDWIYQKSYANEIEACMYAGAEKEADGNLKGWRSYGSREWLTKSIFSVKQDVTLLNEKIVEYTVIKPLKELIAEGKVDPDAIEWYLPHYSSDFFRNKMYAGMKKANCHIPQEKWFTNLSSKGNTGSASIFIILEELFHSGRLKKGERLLCFIPESGRFSTAFLHLSVV